MSNDDVCRSCSAPIMWLNHRLTGKPAPIDLVPSARGNLSVEDGLYVRCSDTSACAHAEHYTAHFGTCPNAAQHRGKHR